MRRATPAPLIRVKNLRHPRARGILQFFPSQFTPIRFHLRIPRRPLLYAPPPSDRATIGSFFISRAAEIPIHFSPHPFFFSLATEVFYEKS